MIMSVSMNCLVASAAWQVQTQPPHDQGVALLKIRLVHRHALRNGTRLNMQGGRHSQEPVPNQTMTGNRPPKRALRATKDALQSTIKQLETCYEELERSNRGLESLNEALSAVNQQLQNNVFELEAANNDLNNLLASSQIAMLHLDRELRIKWLSPAMHDVFNLIASDIGRPIGEFGPAVAGSDLVADAVAVLHDLAPLQKVVEAAHGRWYIRRMLPYRSDSVIVTFTDVTESKQAIDVANEKFNKLTDSLERQVQERTAQLRALASELTMAEERERRSLAQDLHDDLGQLLAIAKIKLTTLKKDRQGGAMEQSLEEIDALIDQANRSVRSLAFQLNPAVLYELGLVPALQWLVEEVRRLSGLDVTLEDDGAPKPLDHPVRSILFRAVRELLINVAKHAKVGSAEVITARSGGNWLTITVGDSGTGFDHETMLAQVAAGDARGFGLLSMRERLRFIGGDMRIDSAPGNGTRVTLSAPLLKQETGLEEAHP